jgi:hypothetical protein
MACERWELAELLLAPQGKSGAVRTFADGAAAPDGSALNGGPSRCAAAAATRAACVRRGVLGGFQSGGGSG